LVKIKRLAPFGDGRTRLEADLPDRVGDGLIVTPSGSGMRQMTISHDLANFKDPLKLKRNQDAKQS
jgi:hypothetical protein